jgi:hypothetical protein
MCTATPSRCCTQRSSTLASAFRPECACVSWKAQAVAKLLPDLMGQVQQKDVAAAGARGFGPVGGCVVGLQHLHLLRLQRQSRLGQQAAQVAKATRLALQVQRFRSPASKPAFVRADALRAKQHLGRHALRRRSGHPASHAPRPAR